MDPVLLTGAGLWLLYLLRSKKQPTTPKGSLKILESYPDGSRVKYEMVAGTEIVRSWIFASDPMQIYEQGNFIFSAMFTPDKKAISFFIYQKGNPDKLIFSTAYTVGLKKLS